MITLEKLRQVKEMIAHLVVYEIVSIPKIMTIIR